ncbi:MAG: MFS transporter [Anaerolineae bacterium]
MTIKTDTGSQSTTVSARDLLKILDFRRLWLGQIVSQFGDALTHLTLILFLNRITGGSTQAIAVLLIALTLPTATLGLVAGVFVDRWQRKRVMIVSDVLRAGLTLGFAAAVVWDQLWLIYVIAFLHASVSAFFDPARSATLPRVVPEEGLLAANSLSQMSTIFFRVLGTAAAGFLVGTLNNFQLAFYADAATFFVSALLLSRLRLPPRELAQAAQVNLRAIWRELSAGLGIIVRTRVLAGILVAMAVTMLGIGALNVLLAPMVVNELRLPETWFGALEFTQTSAMIVGGMFVTMLAARFKSTSIVSSSLIVLGLGAAAFYTVTKIWHLFPILFGIGLVVTPLNAAITTLMQTAVSNELLGRISSALNAVIQSSSLISMFLAGTVAALVGVRNVFVISGAIIVIAGFASAGVFRGYGRPSLSPGLVLTASPALDNKE